MNRGTDRLPETNLKLERLLREGIARLYEIDEAVFTDVLEVPIPTALREAILTRAELASSRLLASRLKAAALAIGATPDDLVRAAKGRERQAVALLNGFGDPRDVGVPALVALLCATGLHLREWRDLLRQVVAQFVAIEPQRSPAIFTDLLAGKSSQKRQLAHNPDQIKAIAEAFLADLDREWARASAEPESS